MTTTLTIDRVHLAPPYLVHFAQAGQPVTYGQLSRLIGVNPHGTTSASSIDEIHEMSRDSE